MFTNSSENFSIKKLNLIVTIQYLNKMVFRQKIESIIKNYSNSNTFRLFYRIKNNYIIIIIIRDNAPNLPVLTLLGLDQNCSPTTPRYEVQIVPNTGNLLDRLNQPGVPYGTDKKIDQ